MQGWYSEDGGINNTYFINVTTNYWLLSPHFWNGGDARINAIHTIGQIGYGGSLGECGVHIVLGLCFKNIYRRGWISMDNTGENKNIYLKSGIGSWTFSSYILGYDTISRVIALMGTGYLHGELNSYNGGVQF